MNAFTLYKISSDEVDTIQEWCRVSPATRWTILWYYHGAPPDEFTMDIFCLDEDDLTEVKLKWGYRF